MWIILLIVAVAALIIAFGPWFKSYRTIIVQSLSGVFLGALPLLTQFSGFLEGLDWQKYVDAKYASVIFIVVSLVGIYLRFKSKGAVGEK